MADPLATPWEGFLRGDAGSDADLWIALAREGERVALDFAKRNRIPSPHDTAREIAQETVAGLIAAGADALRAKGVRTPSAWLRTVVTRACLQTFRRGAVRSSYLRVLSERLRAPAGEAGGGETSPERAAARAEAAGRLLAALQVLEPRKRDLLVLRDMRELPYREVARATGLPVSQIGPRLQRAREELRRLLQASIPSPPPHAPSGDG